jgi:hypothetical protein
LQEATGLYKYNCAGMKHFGNIKKNSDWLGETTNELEGNNIYDWN